MTDGDFAERWRKKGWERVEDGGGIVGGFWKER